MAYLRKVRSKRDFFDDIDGHSVQENQILRFLIAKGTGIDARRGQTQSA
jgi:hypothetical protein